MELKTAYIVFNELTAKNVETRLTGIGGPAGEYVVQVWGPKLRGRDAFQLILLQAEKHDLDLGIDNNGWIALG